jgi:hypothetical protein
MITKDTGVWLAALVTLATYSYLAKENPLFRMIEHFYVGIASGHAVAMAVVNLRDLGTRPLLGGQFIVVVPLLLGLLFYARYLRRPALARLPLAVLTGIGAGTALRSLPGASVLAQLRATIVAFNSVDNIVLALGVVSVLSYFLFTTPQWRAVRLASDLGKVFMMVTFGASFGATVFAGHSLIVGSLELLLGRWLGVLPK